MSIEKFWQKQPKYQDRGEIQQGITEYTDESHNDEKVDYYKDIPKGLVSTMEIFERHNVAFEEIYVWYASAMTRRNRTPLDQDNFENHFNGGSYEPTYAFGDCKKGYVLGYVQSGLFIPTHFAPQTLFSGYVLIRQLGESTDIPSVMAVTEDLQETLSKIPAWKTFPVSFDAFFREQLVSKTIVYNAHPESRQRIQDLFTKSNTTPQ